MLQKIPSRGKNITHRIGENICKPYIQWDISRMPSKTDDS